MSADNWTTCPRCKQEAQKHINAREVEVAAMYGHAPIEEFDLARENLQSLKDAPAPITFREDCEFYGAEEGEVTAAYRGSCKECGLSLKFQHTVTMDLEA